MKRKSILEFIKSLVPWLIGVSLLAIVILWYNWFIIDLFGVHRSAGTFGDSYGPLGVIISGLALVGVIITVIIQQSQIKEQRHHLARSEMNDTFFKLLDHFDEIKQEILGAESDNGKEFTSLYDELVKSFLSSSDNSDTQKYSDFYQEHAWSLNKYFRYLMYFLKYLNDHSERDGLRKGEERLYSNLFRTKISQEEQAIIYFNMVYLDNHERKKLLQKYIRKFNLIRDLDDWTGIPMEHQKSIKEFLLSCET